MDTSPLFVLNLLAEVEKVMKSAIYDLVISLLIWGILIFFLVLMLVPQFLSLHDDCQKCWRAEMDLLELGSDFDLVEKWYLDSLIEGVSEQESYQLVDLDPWGYRYFYSLFQKDGSRCFAIWTFGSDGSPGGVEEHELDVVKFSCEKDQ